MNTSARLVHRLFVNSNSLMFDIFVPDTLCSFYIVLRVLDSIMCCCRRGLQRRHQREGLRWKEQESSTKNWPRGIWLNHYRYKLIHKMISHVSIQRIRQSLALFRDIYGTFCFPSFPPPLLLTYTCLHHCVWQCPLVSAPSACASSSLVPPQSCHPPSAPSTIHTELSHPQQWVLETDTSSQEFSHRPWAHGMKLPSLELWVLCSLLWSAHMDVPVHPSLNYWKANYLSKLTLNSFLSWFLVC